MQPQEVKQFIEQLFERVWVNLDVTQVANFYHQDIEAKMGGQVIQFDDLVNRINFVKAEHGHFRNQIIDMVAEEDKVAVYCEQWYGDNPTKHNILCLYTLESGKVKTLQMCVNSTEDYFQTASK